ncbi:helix-turn-helix domain-containing protein [Streptomyces sp. NBC_00414]|uniref:helix-turn-helix domain-containing protein n=1 Tax=Streptomyces sp. NBC_00414 TaxID=2975739 RepID=UPI002E235D70
MFTGRTEAESESLDLSARWTDAVGQARTAMAEGRLPAVVGNAASRTDVVDLRHLPAEIFVGGPRLLSRMQALERDEIVRCLTEPGTTVARAADVLGLSRATVYRKITQYDIVMPARTR